MSYEPWKHTCVIPSSSSGSIACNLLVPAILISESIIIVASFRACLREKLCMTSFINAKRFTHAHSCRSGASLEGNLHSTSISFFSSVSAALRSVTSNPLTK